MIDFLGSNDVKGTQKENTKKRKNQTNTCD